MRNLLLTAVFVLSLTVPSVGSGINTLALVQQQKLTASDAAAGDLFGQAVSLDGDTAIVGAWLDDNSGGSNAGSAYVFTRSGSVWTFQQKLTAADAAVGDNFGFSVSIKGDTLVVGSINSKNSGGQPAGAAYVFTRTGGVWSQQQRIQAADTALNDQFGRVVSVDGDTVLITAVADDDGGDGSGSAYVYTRSAGVWTQQQKLHAADAAAGDNFGNSVSLSVDSVVIGAQTDDNAGGTDSGAAYVFTRSGGAWTQQAKLTASDPFVQGFFGYSVSLDGDTALVGSYTNGNAAHDAGAAYVFTRSGGVWTQQQRLQASNFAADDLFGASVSISGDTAVISSLLDDNSGGVDAGCVYLFTRSGGVWTEQERFQAADAAANDSLGNSVSLSGGTVIVGAYQDDNSAGVDAGAAYIFAPASATAARSQISGRVTDINGGTVAGVVMRLSGTQTRLTITDESGAYRFDNVETSGFYLLAPSRANFSFAPTQRAFSQLGSVTNAFFNASPSGNVANPIDTPEYFVRQQYLDFLDREPDEPGLNFWVSKIESCGTDANCRAVTRLDISVAFFFSLEFQQQGAFIFSLYKASLGRQPAFAEYAAERQKLRSGDAQEADREAFAQSVVLGSEFIAKYASSITADSFIDALLREAQFAQLDMSGERENLLTVYHTGASSNGSRAAVVRALAENAGFKQANYNAAFVLTEYFGYLRRDPDDSGYRFWLSVLNESGSNNPRGMVCSFITSTEYQRRFGLAVTHSNGECPPQR